MLQARPVVPVVPDVAPAATVSHDRSMVSGGSINHPGVAMKAMGAMGAMGAIARRKHHKVGFRTPKVIRCAEGEADPLLAEAKAAAEAAKLQLEAATWKLYTSLVGSFLVGKWMELLWGGSCLGC